MSHLQSREIRVFLSSTFRDMQFERDHLIKNVFPQIRQACRKRLVEFTEIDLRWGVTQEEAEQGKVVRICLEEIDRCRPFFIGFMGERYGWAPSDVDIQNKQELIALFPIVETSVNTGKSVTEMEVLHGVLNHSDMEGYAYFYLRAPELSNKLAIQTNSFTEYFETDERAKIKLEDLKTRVKKSGFPVLQNYQSIDKLGEQIKTDLLDVLDHCFPEAQTPGPLQIERDIHDVYAGNRRKAYIANPADISALDDFLKLRNSGKCSLPIIIAGDSGLGKSALLAYWINRIESNNPSQFIIQHYSGVSGYASPEAILSRIMLEIKDRTQDQDEVPIKPDDIIQDFPLWLAKVTNSDPLMVVLDAINQIEGDNLNWLPTYFPPNVTLVASCLPGLTFDQLALRGWQIHAVKPLDEYRREQLIDTYLASYSKTLSKSQKQTIAYASQCANPLFLLTVLEELRVFGSFEQLDAKMKTCLTATNPAELFDIVLARMEADYDKKIVKEVMLAIWAARKGLSENELLGITGFTRLNISNFLLALDFHLARKGGLLNYFHDYLRQAVKVRYLPLDSDEKTLHLKLASWFDHQVLDARKVDELPWQWKKANRLEDLRNCIVNIDMFSELYSNDEYELYEYWSLLKKEGSIGNEYQIEFDNWAIQHCTKIDEISERSNCLGMFLVLVADYKFAEKFYLRSLNCCENIYGVGHLSYTSRLSNLGQLMREIGNLDKAEIYSRNALDIVKKILNIPDKDIATYMGNLALITYAKGNLEEAEKLFIESIRIIENDSSSSFERAMIVNNLGLLYRAQRKDRLAELQFKKALKLLDQSSRAKQPDFARIIDNMGGQFEDREEFDEAEKMYRQAHEIFLKIFGNEHPEIAISLGNIARMLEAKGNFEEAERMHKQALWIYEKSFGKLHSNISATLNCLAGNNIRQKKYSEAIKYYSQALKIDEAIFGKDHKNTCIVRNNLEHLQSNLKLLNSIEVKPTELSIKTINTSHQPQKGEGTMSMRITEVIVKWLEEQEWEERPEVDEEEQTSSTGFGHSISEDFSARCFLEAAEKAGFIKLYMYFDDSKIPASKVDEVIKYVNLVNVGIPIGLLSVLPEKKVLRFYAGIDVEEAALEPRHITNLLNAGLRTLELRLPQFMAICFGGKTAEEALEIEAE